MPTKFQKTRPIKKSKKNAVVKAQDVEKILAEYKEVVEARYRIAMAVYKAQDSYTQEVLDRIRDRLRIASTGIVQIGGQPHKLEQQYVDFNLMFIATEILSDLAMNDIQVANFNFHPAYCAECRKEIMKVDEPKKKKKGKKR